VIQYGAKTSNRGKGFFKKDRIDLDIEVADCARKQDTSGVRGPQSRRGKSAKTGKLRWARENALGQSATPVVREFPRRERSQRIHGK